jgi:hypothetical protein
MDAQTSPKPTVGVLARFEFRPGVESEILRFFRQGLAIVEGQPASTLWFAYRISDTAYGAFAAFATESDRNALLSAGGPKLSQEFAGLFASAPRFEKVDVVEARVGG